MLIGIDVGGTFTDGVLIEGREVLRKVKTPTETGDLSGTLLEALDVLISGVRTDQIERLVLSTTLVTNMLATGKGEEAALLLIPGPGLRVCDLDLPGYVRTISGAVDFRGRIIEDLKEAEVLEAGADIHQRGVRRVAVVGKFSGRNPALEEKAAALLAAGYPDIKVIRGFDVSGRLNFVRRAVTSYYTAITEDSWRRFVVAMEEAIRKRGITCPVDILKADGGTMSLSSSLNCPCETVFSGPAASAMGAVALIEPEVPAVVVDIGGTTTDLALILDKEPLFASKGARIEGRYTQIQAVAVSSLPLGGDSLVSMNKGDELAIGPDRLGPAACYGGNHPTPTDAYNIVNNGVFGNLEASREVFAPLASVYGHTLEEVAAETLRVFVGGIYDGILAMFRQWENEPAYKVWEIVHRRRIKPEMVIGIGAAAILAVDNLGKLFSARPVLHEHAAVGNALGAAAARPTLQVMVHVDTATGRYTANLDGIEGRIEKGSSFQMKEARDLASRIMAEACSRRGMEEYTGEQKVFLEEQFNVIRGWDRVGRIFDVGLQIAPGVIPAFRGVK